MHTQTEPKNSRTESWLWNRCEQWYHGPHVKKFT